MAYAIVGMAWFIVVNETSILPFLYEDYIFIAVSAVFWYLVGRRDLLAIDDYEEKLRESEERFRVAFEKSAVGKTLTDIDGRFIKVNEAFSITLGYPGEELVSRHFEEITYPEDIAVSRKWVRALLSGETDTCQFEKRYIHKDGHIVWVLLNASLYRDISNDPKYFITDFQDITLHKHAEEALRKSENMYRILAEAAQDAIYIINREDRVEYVNSFGAGLLGLKPEDMIGSQRETLFPPDVSKLQKENLKKVFETGKSLYAEDKISYLKEEAWMHTSLVPMRDDAGEVTAAMGISRDITDRKKAEEELRLLQTMTQAITESDDFFSALDITLRKVCKTTGWVYGETWIPSPDNSYVKLTPPWYSGIEGLEEFRKASETFRFHKDVGIPGRAWSSKKPLWVRDVSADKNLPRAPIASKSGLHAAIGIPILAGEEVVAVLVFFVTEARNEDERFIALISAIASQLGALFRRKMAEDTLRDSERKLRLITENTTDVILAYDMNRRLIYVNPAVKRLTGYSVEEIKERNYIDWSHPDNEEKAKRLWEGLFEGKGFTDEEVRIITKDGQIKWSLSSWGPMYNGGPQQIGVQGVERDITERKRVEEELQLLQILVQDISLAEDFGSALYVSLRKICIATGWVFGEAWVPSEDGSHLECSPVWYSSFEGLKKFRKISEEFEFQPGIGLPGRVWSSKKSAWVIDVTKDSNFPRAPYAMEAGLKAGMAIPVLAGEKVVAVLDFFVQEPKEEDRRLVELVSTVAAYLGILFQRKRAEEILKKNEEKYRTLISNIPDVAWTADSKGNTVFISSNVERVYGYPPDEIYKDPIGLWFGRINPDDARMVKELFELLFSENKKFDVEYRIQRKDGEWIWLHDRSVSTYKKDGTTYADGIFSDITEYKKLEAQLRHSQKLEAIGRLVGGIAHDFNNMLTSIIGFAGILQMKMDKDDPLIVEVEQIMESAERGANLTRNLLVFGRKQAINPEPVDLFEITKKVDRLLSRLLGENIEIRILSRDEELTVMADSVQIEQALINLATNARDAMPDGGVLTIETSRERLDEEFIKTHGYGKPGRFAMITVSDTGTGMDEKTRERIFEPFFTTKDMGKGTGLGLAIVYGIVKQHNGYINVYSEVGKGTTFRIYLPLVKAEVPEAKTAKPLPPVVGTETVLVAEDDTSVRSLSKKLLESFGYKVIEAVDGEDAVNKFRENKDKIQFLLLDVMMPKKNGKEAYDEIKNISPDIKTLFMSGYTSDAVMTRGIVEAGLNFVSKPISPTDFLKKVREVLDK